MKKLLFFSLAVALTTAIAGCDPNTDAPSVKSISVGAQSAEINIGDLKEVTFPITIEGKINGNFSWDIDFYTTSAGTTATSFPPGIFIAGVEFVSGNTGTVKLKTQTGLVAGIYYFGIMINGVRSNVAILMIEIPLIGDGDWYAYQTHSTGNGVDLVFMGDGYSALDIAQGKYEKDMKTAIEGFFEIEPYKAYRHYFNAYVVWTVSDVSGIGTGGTPKNTKLSTFHGSGSSMDADRNLCFAYALKAPIKDIDKSVVILVANSTEWGGTCWMWSSGRAIAMQPSDAGTPLLLKHLVQHEAGGHGFGKLADEYVNEGTAASRSRDDIRSNHASGWYVNVDVTNDTNEVIWKDFIGHPKYPMVGVFEGGYYFSTGVWRPENVSAMGSTSSTITRPFNAPSRAAIVKRIKELAGEAYTIEGFISTDIIEVHPGTNASTDWSILRSTAPPVVINNI